MGRMNWRAAHSLRDASIHTVLKRELYRTGQNAHKARTHCNLNSRLRLECREPILTPSKDE